MAKKLLCLILSSVFTWMLSCPEPLSASNFATISGLDSANVVETVLPAPKPQVVRTNVAVPATARLAQTPALAPKPALPANHIEITGRRLNIVNVSATTAESGNHVNRIGKLLYGHNSSTVFGGLKNLKVGSTFSVTLNGKTTNYRISYIDTYEKNGAHLQKNGERSYMAAIQKAKDVNRVEHDLAIMTCAGRSLGGGDATHRLVIFADAI